MLKRYLEYRFKQKHWKFSGHLPKRIKKCIILVAPHTSREDFFLGVAVSGLSHYSVNILVNQKHFVFPTSIILKKLGAIPYDPLDESALADTLNKEFKSSKSKAIAIAPQAAQQNPDVWNTGFYDFSLKSGIPIALAGLDYRRKIVKLHSWFNVSGDKARDLNYIRNFFADIEGKHSERSVHRNNPQDSKVLKNRPDKNTNNLS